MSGHNISGDMYARCFWKTSRRKLNSSISGWWPSRRPPIRSSCGCPSCRSPTPRLTRWFAFSAASWFLFHHFVLLSHLKLSLSAFCSFPGASARRGDLGKKSFQFLHKKSRRCSALILHSFLQVFNPLFKNKNLLLQHPLSWSCFPFSPILVMFIGFDITDADELFHIVHFGSLFLTHHSSSVLRLTMVREEGGNWTTIFEEEKMSNNAIWYRWRCRGSSSRQQLNKWKLPWRIQFRWNLYFFSLTLCKTLAGSGQCGDLQAVLGSVLWQLGSPEQRKPPDAPPSTG